MRLWRGSHPDAERTQALVKADEPQKAASSRQVAAGYLPRVTVLRFREVTALAQRASRTLQAEMLNSSEHTGSDPVQVRGGFMRLPG